MSEPWTTSGLFALSTAGHAVQHPLASGICLNGLSGLLPHLNNILKLATSTDELDNAFLELWKVRLVAVVSYIKANYPDAQS